MRRYMYELVRTCARTCVSTCTVLHVHTHERGMLNISGIYLVHTCLAPVYVHICTHVCTAHMLHTCVDPCPCTCLCTCRCTRMHTPAHVYTCPHTCLCIFSSPMSLHMSICIERVKKLETVLSTFYRSAAPHLLRGKNRISCRTLAQRHAASAADLDRLSATLQAEHGVYMRRRAGAHIHTHACCVSVCVCFFVCALCLHACGYLCVFCAYVFVLFACVFMCASVYACERSYIDRFRTCVCRSIRMSIHSSTHRPEPPLPQSGCGRLQALHCPRNWRTKLVLIRIGIEWRYVLD